MSDENINNSPVLKRRGDFRVDIGLISDGCLATLLERSRRVRPLLFTSFKRCTHRPKEKVRRASAEDTGASHYPAVHAIALPSAA